MEKEEFYKHYIPVLIKVLDDGDKCNQELYCKGPERYLDLPENKMREIDLYLEESAGNDIFLDKVAYYLDAKSHNFNKIDGVSLENYKKGLKKEISTYIEKYNIKKH